jgi:dTDP-glucose 4,6-dehydratase
MRILVTGAAGFIGSAFVREAKAVGHQIAILDALTYAGHRENIESILDAQCSFTQGDIADTELVSQLLKEGQAQAVVNFAAESHVDNSITGPRSFLQTNILGTFSLLEAARHYRAQLNAEQQASFRFLQISTDEVYGSLGDRGSFTETSPYQPNSPYSASKAAADHLVRAWHHTYGLPTITTNCSNNYGPRQFPEKLIPLMIQHALNGLSLPVYGQGANTRDWIHVEDHSRGVLLALEKGRPGETYCLGGRSERTNLQVVQAICATLQSVRPRSGGYESLIEFVKDRPGHDWRYAIDDSKAVSELGFSRRYNSFEEGLKATVHWYLENQNWVRAVSKGKIL